MSKQLSIFKESDLQRYLAEVSKIKLLSEKEEQELVTEFYNTRDIKFANKLVVSHLPLVIKVAYSYRGYGFPIMDLISEGNVGLIRAIKKFDHLKGFRFSTYAMWWVKAYITDYILNSWSMVKSTTLYARKKLFFSLSKIKDKLGIKTSSITENDALVISEETGMAKKDVIDVNGMLYSRDVYLQSKIRNEENSSTLEDIIQDNNNNPEESYIANEQASKTKEIVKSVMGFLNDREKDILLKRYILEKPLSLETIGKQLGISRERVRQIESVALKKAKDFIVSQKQSLYTSF